MTAGAWPRCHSGCLRAKAANSPTVTGRVRIAKGATATGVAIVGTGPCGSTLSKVPPGTATYSAACAPVASAPASNATSRTRMAGSVGDGRLGRRDGALLLHVFLADRPARVAPAVQDV